MQGETRPLRVLAFEPFDAGSHRAIRESIERHSSNRWRWTTRPARGWKWRMRLGAAELVERAMEQGLFDEPADIVVASSLLSAADLRALLPRGQRDVPLVVYMHENQVEYPVSAHPGAGHRDVHFAITNLTSLLAADGAIFNSRWNLESFLEGMEEILRRASAVRLRRWRGVLERRSRVIWPPVEAPPPEIGALVQEKLQRSPGGPIRVVWPHRWEHDKGPDEFLVLARRESERLDLRWTVLGYEYPRRPEALEAFRRDMASRIDHMGFEPQRLRYWEHLARCDWVLSTARHEFFGIGVVEALLAGCLPWLPQRLSYREILPPEARGLRPGRGGEPDRQALHRSIREWLAPAVAPRAVAAIDQALQELWGSKSPGSTKEAEAGRLNAAAEGAGRGRDSP